MNQELIKQLLSELIKLTVSGLIGGVFGSLIGLKAFKSQRRFETKHDDFIRKRDALRDVLIMLPWIYRDILVDWDNPIDEGETPQKHVMNIRNKFSQWKAIFLNDPTTWNAIESLDLLVGSGKDSFFSETKLYAQSPSEIIDNVEKTIKEKILEIEKEIT